MITSPDQHKPGHRKASLVGAVISAIALLTMLMTTSTGAYGYIFVVLTALGLVGIWLADWALRKNGLRRRN